MYHIKNIFKFLGLSRGCHTTLSLLIIICNLLFVLVLLTGCVSVFSDLQSAKLAGKGKFEVTPSYSSIYFSNCDGTEHVQNHLGLQVAYGMRDDLDLRFRYEIISPEFVNVAVNVLGFGPKFGMSKDRSALYLPIGFAFGEDITTSETCEFHPTLLFTLPVGNNFELNPSAKVMIPLPLSRMDSDVLFAFNLGAGISADLQKWVLRPELGFLFYPGGDGYYRHLSIGFTVFP